MSHRSSCALIPNGLGRNLNQRLTLRSQENCKSWGIGFCGCHWQFLALIFVVATGVHASPCKPGTALLAPTRGPYHGPWFPTPPTGTSNTSTWSSDITSLLMSFLLYVERDPSSPFLKLEVLTMFHIVIFFIKPLGYLLASSNHYCLAPPAPSLLLG